MADPSASKAWVPDDIKWNGYLFEAQATATKPAKPRRKRNYDNAVCQVEGCVADLRAHKEYHQRYKICEFHLRVPSLLKDGVQQRFCQQCGCFHLLEKFDDTKRSCRAKLQRHNERRRKPAKLKAEPCSTSLLATSGSLSGALTDTSLGAPYGAPSMQAGSPSGTSIKRTASGSDDSSCQNHFSNKRPRSPIFPPNEFVSSILPMPVPHRARPSSSRSPVPPNPFQQPQGLPLDVISPFLDPEPSDPHIATSPVLNLLHHNPAAPTKGPTLSSNDSSSTSVLPHSAPPGLATPLATAHSATTLSLPAAPSNLLPPFDLPSITSPHSINTPPATHTPSPVHDIDLMSLSHAPFPASAPHPSLCLDPFTSAPPLHEASHSSWHDPDPLSALPSAVLIQPPPHLTAPHPLPGPASGTPDMSFLPQDFKDSLSLIPESYAYQKEFDTNTQASIAMSAPLPDSLFHPVMDSPMLAPPQPKDRSHAWLTPQHILQPPPEYHQWERLTTVSLKLFNCGPSDLPATLRQDLMLMIGDVQLMEGFIRPGCVLLTVDTFCPTSAGVPTPAELGNRLALSHPNFWAAKLFEVRHGASLAARFEKGRRQEGGPEEAPAPQINAVLPLCINNPAEQRLLLRCCVADSGSMQLFCRANGEYLHLRAVSRVQDEAVLRRVGAQDDEVVLAAALPDDCPRTLLKFELVCGGRVSPLAVALVAGSVDVAKEVNELMLPRLGHLAAAVLPDIARCLDLAAWLRREYNAARCEVPAEHDSRPSYSPQEVACIVRAARQLLALSCELGWTYTFMALVTIASIGCHNAADVLAAAAAASAKQLPLLHLAVCSRKPEMVQLLLDWGIHHGMVWSDAGVGPAQVTALQLAEAVQDGGAIVELICDALDSDDHARATRPCDCGSDEESESESELETEDEEEYADDDPASAPVPNPAPGPALAPAPAPAPADPHPAPKTAGPEPGLEPLAPLAPIVTKVVASVSASSADTAAPAAGGAGWCVQGVGAGGSTGGATKGSSSSSKGWEAGPPLGEGVVKAALPNDADSFAMDEEEDLKPRPREHSVVRTLRLMLHTGKQMALLFMVLAFINLTMSLLALFAKDEVEVGDLVLG